MCAYACIRSLKITLHCISNVGNLDCSLCGSRKLKLRIAYESLCACVIYLIIISNTPEKVDKNENENDIHIVKANMVVGACRRNRLCTVE